MTSKQQVSFCILGLAVLLLSGCWGTVVRPLQINPHLKPQIVVYHHIQLRTLPVAYAISLNERISEKWKALQKGDPKILLKAPDDFQISRGRPLQNRNQIVIWKDEVLRVNGTLELDYNSVVVDLQIIPGAGVNNHPIDGKYRFTKNEPIEITY